MTAEAIRDEGQVEGPPPPGTKRARRVRMIKRGIKLFFAVFALAIIWLTVTAPLSRSLSNAEAPSLRPGAAARLRVPSTTLAGPSTTVSRPALSAAWASPAMHKHAAAQRACVSTAQTLRPEAEIPRNDYS